MKGHLGEFEELVLLTIAGFDNNAYGTAIKSEIEQRTSRNISIGSLHSTISRLEEKGYLTSYMGGATAERGGRRKRFYELTPSAVSALSDMKTLRDQLWSAAHLKLNNSK